ncbi:MAG: HIT domain-containing protein, partial [Christensenellales bacterium]
MKKDCVFCKIIAGEIPSEKVYEDNLMIIIKDINPQVKKHFLLIPKKHYANIVEMSLEEAVELGESLKTLSTLVDDLG